MRSCCKRNPSGCLVHRQVVTEQQAIELVDQSSFGLAASIWTRDLTRAKRIARQINVGSCSINDVIQQVANPAAALEGIRTVASADTRLAWLRAFSKVKTVMIGRGDKRREMHWFPFSAKTHRQLQAILQLRHGARSGWLKH